MKKKNLIIAAVLAIVLAIGFLVPIGSYTSHYGCQVEPMPTKRLHLIKGDSLDKVKNYKDPPGAGCTINTKYVLYVL